jgi:hypothetical protein
MAATSSNPKIRVIPLDAFVAEHQLKRIDFIKVDIEGHEPYFVEGARKTLGRFLPPMLMEFNKEMLPRQGYTAEMLMERLRGLGYREFFTRKDRFVWKIDESSIFDEGVCAFCSNVYSFRETPARFAASYVSEESAGFRQSRAKSNANK